MSGSGYLPCILKWGNWRLLVKSRIPTVQKLRQTKLSSKGCGLFHEWLTCVIDLVWHVWHGLLTLFEMTYMFYLPCPICVICIVDFFRLDWHVLLTLSKVTDMCCNQQYFVLLHNSFPLYSLVCHITFILQPIIMVRKLLLGMDYEEKRQGPSYRNSVGVLPVLFGQFACRGRDYLLPVESQASGQL